MATKPAKNPKPNKKSNSNLKNQHAPYHLTSKPREDFGCCCIPDLSLQFLLEVCMFQLSVFTLQEGSAASAPLPAQEALSWCQSLLPALGSLGNTSPSVSLEGPMSKDPSSCTKCSSDCLKGRNTPPGFLLKIQTCSFSCP